VVGLGRLAGSPWPPRLESVSTAGGVPEEVPAATVLNLGGIAGSSSSFKKAKVLGSEGEVDISEKGNTDSSNTTWREMIIRLE
jgi:hypothetical protein